VLTIFTLTGGAATAGVLGDMLVKSLLGYLVAFGAGAVIFLLIARMFETWVAKTNVEDEHSPPWAIPAVAGLIMLCWPICSTPVRLCPISRTPTGCGLALSRVAALVHRVPPRGFNTWFVLQWLSTGFLWSQWLMQDLANIFVYLPRQTVVDPRPAM
jgi:hypothetical protein